jgi:hypothetical protein
MRPLNSLEQKKNFGFMMRKIVLQNYLKLVDLELGKIGQKRLQVNWQSSWVYPVLSMNLRYGKKKKV